MTRSRHDGQSARVLATIVALALAAAPASAQRATPAALSPRSDTVAIQRKKSRAIAVGLGTIFPGSAHWYACESGRGWVRALVYWTGVVVVQGGRTDAVEAAGGVALLGALAFSIIDGTRAVGRHNERVRAGLPTACARRAR